jgi:hypothetical protein
LRLFFFPGEPGQTWGPIAPVFLPSLVHIINDFSIERGNFRFPKEPHFPITAFPGLANLRQVGGSILIDDTFISRSEFTSLQCLGGSVSFNQNVRQTSLEGMDRLIQVNYVPKVSSGPTVVISAPNNITTPAALAPLSRAANCGGTEPDLRPSIVIAVCAREIATWAALCSFIATGTCP